MTENQSEVGSWDNYINNFLKAEDVGSVEEEYVCIGVQEVSFDDSKTLRLTLEKAPIKYLFDLNKTNSVFVKNNGIKHPLDIVGKKVKFDKVKVFNPQLKKEVDGLRIISIE